MTNKTVVVEGWRFIAHSYAVVNQYQCLELLKRPDVTLFHRDVPFVQPNWRAVPGTLPAAHEQALRSIPSPPPGLKADALLRIGFPHFFENSPEAQRTFVWGTSEFKRLRDDAMGNGRKPREALSKAEALVIACSGWAAQGFLNSGLPESKIVVVPCGVDLSVFSPIPAAERAELRKELGWANQFVALNVSAVTNNKGVDIAFKAISRLAQDFPNLRLCLKGSDSLYRSSEYTAGALGTLSRPEQELVRSRLTYVGKTLAAGDVANLYRAADVYLSPYRAEGFNLPVLEAAACGLPVICTRGGSTDDFADDSWALRIDGKVEFDSTLGWQIQPSLEQCCAHLARAVTDAGWRAAASAAGPAWVRDRFTWKHSVDKLLKVMLPD